MEKSLRYFDISRVLAGAVSECYIVKSAHSLTLTCSPAKTICSDAILLKEKVVCFSIKVLCSVLRMREFWDTLYIYIYIKCIYQNDTI